MAAAIDDHDVTLYLLLAGLCFLRSQELVRRLGNEEVLLWTDVWIDRKLIHVREGVGKSTRRKSGNERFPPVHPNLLDWLKLYKPEEAREDNRVIPFSVRHFRTRLKKVFDEAGVRLINNGLRHSAISYMLAAYPDIGLPQIAEWAGGSEASCRLHYLRALTKDQGRAWFEESLPPEPG